MTDLTVMPADRFEWERLVRRIVLPGPVKLLALILATYADPDGTRVRPGLGVLADVTGRDEKTVRRHLAVLLDLDLVHMVAKGGGRGGKGTASEFRLTVPTDLLDRATLLNPGERTTKSTVDNCPVDDQTPVDQGESLDIQMSTQSEGGEPNEWTFSDPKTPIEWTFSGNEWTSGCPTTKSLPPTTMTKPTTHLPTQQPNARDPTAVEAA